MKRFGYFLPLGILAVLAAYLVMGLGRNPQDLPSALINTPVPTFQLPPIKGQKKGFSNLDLVGQVTLVNVFGSWCEACRLEHDLLMSISKKKLVPIFGIDWQEPNPMAGPAWLKRHGNPYTLVGNDPKSRGAIAFGVTKAPESFLIDKTGVIRFKRTGRITEALWNETVWPIVQKLKMQ